MHIGLWIVQPSLTLLTIFWLEVCQVWEVVCWHAMAISTMGWGTVLRLQWGLWHALQLLMSVAVLGATCSTLRRNQDLLHRLNDGKQELLPWSTGGQCQQWIGGGSHVFRNFWHSGTRWMCLVRMWVRWMTSFSLWWPASPSSSSSEGSRLSPHSGASVRQLLGEDFHIFLWRIFIIIFLWIFLRINHWITTPLRISPFCFLRSS